MCGIAGILKLSEKERLLRIKKEFNEILYNVSKFSELLLFKGNNVSGSGGPDRIRLRSGEIRFQIYYSSEAYSAFNDNNNALIINSSGKLSINSNSPSQQLEINNAIKIVINGK